LEVNQEIHANIPRMSQAPLRIEDQPADQSGQRVLRLTGPLVLNTVFAFQAIVREDSSRSLIIDFTNVPYVDSAGIGVLVGAYVTRQDSGRSLALVGVIERIHDALKVTGVEKFFQFFDSVSAAQRSTAA
jgi:anti-sigma B factor antagonist